MKNYYYIAFVIISLSVLMMNLYNFYVYGADATPGLRLLLTGNALLSVLPLMNIEKLININKQKGERK